jgi:endonuclease III
LNGVSGSGHAGEYLTAIVAAWYPDDGRYRMNVAPRDYGQHVPVTSTITPVTALPPVPSRRTLAPLRNGSHDPTTKLSAGELWRATLTPDGPGTLHLDWRDGTLRPNAWGPGADWLIEGVPALVGQHDQPVRFTDAHPAIIKAQRNVGEVRFGASRTLYHELLPTILAQRITAGEAINQWQWLCIELGEIAPGPRPDLRLPPAPVRLASMPGWWFHPLGIERKRAEALIVVARHARHLAEWSMLPSADAAHRLSLLRGIGEWTIGVVLASAMGEPDAVAVGDFHLKNIIGWALAGEARATDERMLELLQPYRGQRGRVVRLLTLDGNGAPKFGPRKRILPMHQW